nr:MAG TPA: nucleoid-associated protein [Caudoviricetes sp.]
MANTWNQVGTLMGPQGPQGGTGEKGATGPQGPQGPKGADGTSVTAGTGAPSGTAVVGSVYIDASTGNLYTYKA